MSVRIDISAMTNEDSADRVTWVPKSCIMFATADWDEPYWTNKQHCAKSLAEIGSKVLYIESVGLRSPKANSKKDLKRMASRLIKGLYSFIFGAKEVASGIYVLSPLIVPAGHSRPFLRWINKQLFRSMLARSVKRLKISGSLVWTYHPFMLDVIGDACYPVVYHCVDDISAMPGVDSKAYRKAEEVLIRRADMVFTTAPELTKRCMKFNSNTYFLPNVVDFKHFSQANKVTTLPSDLSAIPEPRLCYVGVLSDFKIDFELMLELAEKRPEWQWVLIGEEREGQSNEALKKLSSLPNVHCLGYRPYAQLPEYLAGMSVGLLPTLINDYTASMFPMKFYEYISAGLGVVATDLNFLKEFGRGIEICPDSASFEAGIERLIKQGSLSTETIKRLVGDNTWEQRLGKMLSMIADNKKFR